MVRPLKNRDLSIFKILDKYCPSLGIDLKILDKFPPTISTGIEHRRLFSSLFHPETLS